MTDHDDMTPADVVLRYFSVMAGALLAVMLVASMCSG